MNRVDCHDSDAVHCEDCVYYVDNKCYSKCGKEFSGCPTKHTKRERPELQNV